MSGRDPDPGKSGNRGGGSGGGGGERGPPDGDGKKRPPAGSPPGAPRDHEVLKKLFGEEFVRAKRVVDGLPDEDSGDKDTPSIRKQLHQYPGVQGVAIGQKVTNGVGTNTISIIVYVREKHSEDDLEDELILPASIDGVDVDVQETGEIRLDKHNDPPLQDSPPYARTDDSHEADLTVRSHTLRPVFGGISGGHVDITAGTIGAPFEDSGGSLVWLTNRHIAAEDDRDTTGEDFVQPGPADNSNLHVVGAVRELSEWTADGTNHSDSALITPNNGSDVSDTVLGLGGPGESEIATIGDPYVKSARTSTIRSSPLRARDVSADINAGWTTLYYEGLITFDPVSTGGDSGSLWARYDRGVDTYYPVGLNFASSDTRAFAIPFEAVEAEHGELTPPTTNIDPDFASVGDAIPKIETAPLAFETNNRGQLPLLVLHTGVSDSESEREVRILDGETGDSEIILTHTDTEFSEGDYHIVDLDLARAFSNPDPQLRMLSVDPDHGTFQPYEILLNDQTEWEFDVTIRDADANTLLQGADVLIEEWEENPAVGEEQIGAEVFSGVTDSEGHVRAWLEPGDYRLTVDHPDFLSNASTHTIQAQANATTVGLLTSQTALSTHWDSPNGNPYTNKYPEYVGPQPIGVAFKERDFPPRPRRSNADHICTSVSEFDTAVNDVVEGEMIWLEAGETFNVDYLTRPIQLPQNVTVASDGARIHCSEPRPGVFFLANPGVRLSGLRIEGDHIGFIDADQSSTAIFCRARNLRIDNCEIYGWRTNGIFVGWGQDSPPQHIEPDIHHCIIRDNYQTGSGHGIAVHSGDPLIEYSFVTNCRHGITGGGRPAQSYQAHNNLMGDTFGIWAMQCQSPGGVRMSVRNNEYHLSDDSSYVQRGTPSDHTAWDNNWTHNTTKPQPTAPNTSGASLRQYDHGSTDWANVTWSNNSYGTTAPSDSSIGIQALTRTDETTGAPPPSGAIGRRTLSWSSTTDWGTADSVTGIVADADATARIQQSDSRLGYSLDSRAQSPLETAAAYWPLDINGDDTLGERIATSSNVAFQQAGPISTRGAYFNGSSSAVRTPTDSGVRFSGSFTIHAVVQKTGTKNLQTILRNGYDEPGIVFLALRDNDGISFGFYDEAGNVQYSDTFHTGSVGVGEWNHIAATYDGSSTLRVRLNGSSETRSITGVRPTSPSGSDNDFYIGQRGHPSGDDRYFEGLISNVALFGRALSTAELDQLYAPMSSGRLVDNPRTP